jgi:F1F0 ATPase subunit 2
MLGGGLPTSSDKSTKTKRITIEMNTTEIINLSLATLAGALIGAIFFGGLWWTVCYGLRHKRPGVVFLVSLIGRFAFALIGFYLVGGGNFDRLIACLFGFFLSRVLAGALRFPKAPSLREKKTTTLHYSDTPSLQQPGAEVEDYDENEAPPMDRGGKSCT